MIRELVFFEMEWQRLQAALPAGDPDERGLLLLAAVSESPAHTRLIVREVVAPGPADIVSRGPAHVELSPVFMSAAIARAVRENLALIRCHTHPFTTHPRFSCVDDRTDRRGYFPWLAKLAPGLHHASVVFGRTPEGMDGRLRDPENGAVVPLDLVKVILPERLLLLLPESSPLAETAPDRERDSRTVLAVGATAQSRFRLLKVAIVGAGGLGAIVAEQLARLPVRELVLIDHDTVEVSNLNRLQGITEADVGRLKINALADHLARIAPEVQVTRVPSDLHEPAAREALISTDVIFGCLDSIRARFTLDELAKVHGLVYFDLGTVITAAGGRMTESVGQVITSLPGSGWCFSCRELFSKRAAQLETLTGAEREHYRQLGYVKGANVYAPAVYPLNALIASLGCWILMRYVAGDGRPPAIMSVDACHLTAGPIAVEPSNRKCIICSRDGALGAGGRSADFFVTRPSRAEPVPTFVRPGTGKPISGTAPVIESAPAALAAGPEPSDG